MVVGFAGAGIFTGKVWAKAAEAFGAVAVLVISCIAALIGAFAF